MNVLVVAVFSAFFLSVFASQFCYDCGPNNCTSPSTNNIKSTDCEANAEKQSTATSPPLEFDCFTLFTKNGTYRGCTESRTDVCGYLRETQPHVRDCKHCSYDNCNIEDDVTDTDAGGNSDGAKENSITISLFVANLLLLAYIL